MGTTPPCCSIINVYNKTIDCLLVDASIVNYNLQDSCNEVLEVVGPPQRGREVFLNPNGILVLIPT